MRKAAFFDIDGTLYREHLISAVFRKFITYELVDPRKWTDEVKPTFMKYAQRQGEYDDYLNKMVEIYKETLVGLSSEHIKHIAKMVIEQKGGRVMKMSNKTYDILKYIAQIALPAIGTLYFALARIWALPYAEEIVGTISAVDVFLGAILGISTANYNKQLGEPAEEEPETED